MNSSSIFAPAAWIASPIVGGKRTSVPVPYLRQSFHLDQAVRSAQLVVTALGLYECEINGQHVGDEIFAPGWTEYHKRVQYQTYDVAGLLRPGENVLGAILGDGWYCGQVGWSGRQIYGDRPRLLARLEVILADGSSVIIGTGPSWSRYADGRIL
jgi:alpha-L-rhamnosidase